MTHSPVPTVNAPRRLRHQSRRRMMLARLIARQSALKEQLAALVSQSVKDHARLALLTRELQVMRDKIGAELERRRTLRQKAKSPAVRQIGRRRVLVH